MDSNYRSLSRGSRFILRKVNCGGSTGQPKNFAGTDGSNPSPSSRESVSLPHPLSKVENPGFPRGCARLAWRPGRQRRARCLISRQPAAISLSDQNPVPQCRWWGRRECHACPNEVGPSPGLTWVGLCIRIGLNQNRARSADRARQAADVSAREASLRSNRAAAAHRGSPG
jgi:hypothetical protein